MNKTQHDSEVPAKGKQVITCCAFIYRLNAGQYEVFMPKRAATKKFLPNVFELPGGHIDFGENLIKGLKREIFEEFNTEILVGNVFAAFDYLNQIKGSHSIEIIYFAKFLDDKPTIVLHPDDHNTYNWFTENEILNKTLKNQNSQSDPEITAILKGFKILARNLALAEVK